MPYTARRRWFHAESSTVNWYTPVEHKVLADEECGLPGVPSHPLRQPAERMGPLPVWGEQVSLQSATSSSARVSQRRQPVYGAPSAKPLEEVRCARDRRRGWRPHRDAGAVPALNVVSAAGAPVLPGPACSTPNSTQLRPWKPSSFTSTRSPWDDLAFRTVRMTLERFFADRKARWTHCAGLHMPPISPVPGANSCP